MNIHEKRLLEAVQRSLKGEYVYWQEEIPESDWEQLFRLAEIHHVFPMVFEAVYNCPAAARMPASFFQPYKQKALYEVSWQARKTEEVLALYRYLRAAGISPLIVKGLVCCELYPYKDHRRSVDEDLLIMPEQFERCHELLLGYGMEVMEPEKDIFAEHEVAYKKKDSLLYIELHKLLFPVREGTELDFNYFFRDVFEKAEEIILYGEPVRTLGYTDHLFYLILHAFKHFLYSGFGIRQVCDIEMFANAYGGRIDWERVLTQCRAIRAEEFAAAIFNIGRKYLTFSPEKACYPEKWQEIPADESALLEDILTGGIYGASDRNRLHSSNITLKAFYAQKKKGRFQRAVLEAGFPSRAELKNRFPYLEKYPWLLPAAWIERFLKYGQELKGSKDSHMFESIRIGQKRIELLKKYNVIE